MTAARSVTGVTEHPLLFSAPMIRALLAGTKTMTRRLVKRPAYMTDKQWADAVPNNNTPGNTAFEIFGPTYLMVPAIGSTTGGRVHPVWMKGDRIWCKETWQADPRENGSPPREMTPHAVAYRATHDGPEGHWRPSIFMPRWASRISLEVTEVRVERLQAITEEDARAEGARWTDFGQHEYEMSVDGGATFLPAKSQNAGWSMFPVTRSEQCLGTARMAFANAWNRIHGGERWNMKDGPSPWDVNPWVWIVSFRRATP